MVSKAPDTAAPPEDTAVTPPEAPPDPAVSTFEEFTLDEDAEKAFADFAAENPDAGEGEPESATGDEETPETGDGSAPETDEPPKAIADLSEEELAGDDRVVALLKAAEDKAARTAHGQARSQEQQRAQQYTQNRAFSGELAVAAALPEGADREKAFDVVATRIAASQDFGAYRAAHGVLMSGFPEGFKITMAQQEAWEMAQADPDLRVPLIFLRDLAVQAGVEQAQPGLREEIKAEVAAELKAAAESGRRKRATTKNGVQPSNVTGGGSTTTSFETMAAADAAYADERLSHADYQVQRKKFNVGDR